MCLKEIGLFEIVFRPYVCVCVCVPVLHDSYQLRARTPATSTSSQDEAADISIKNAEM